jgi:hypothetical protein
MQQLIKHSRPFSWVIALFVMSVFFVACNGEEAKKEEPKVEPAATQVAPTVPDTMKKTTTDSLPPIDKKAGPRPETGGTK